MANAACAGSVKRTGGQRKPLVHRSTPNIAAAPQPAVESRRPSGPSGIDTSARTRSTNRGRQPTATSTTESNNRRTGNSAPRSVTSRSVSRMTAAPVQRPTTPTPWSSSRVATSPRQATATSSALTTSKKLFHSTGNLTTMSVASSPPPPRRRMSTNCGIAATKSSPMSTARHQPGSTDSKPVVISGRGSRAQTAAAATSTQGGSGKNASMRSRIGIAPNLLLPNCYQPGKARPRTPARSFSIDASVTASSPDVTAAPVIAAATPPRIRRSVSVQERHIPPSLPLKTAFDDYPEPPPEDKELNSRMEMLFEEYRKVERGLIFSDDQSTCEGNSTANNCASTSTKPPPTTSSKSSSSGVTQTVTAGSKRVGQTVGSTRAKSVGNLVMGSSSTYVSSQQQRSDRTARATPSSSVSGTSKSMSRAVTATSGRPSTTHQRGQSSPGIGRRSAPPPATPPPSRKNAVSGTVTTSRPQQHTGKVVAAPAAGCPNDVAGPTSASHHRARSCGGGGMTRVRRDSLPTSLQDASKRLRDISAAAATDNSSTRVDTTKQAKRRQSTPSCSVTAVQRAVPRSVEQVCMNSRNADNRCNTVSEESRQTAKTVSDSNRRLLTGRTQSTSDVRSDHSAVKVAAKLPTTERRSRPSTVGPRSLIPRPVSCSGRPPAFRRDSPPLTTKPVRFEPVLRRFDSGVDVATVGLSPSDDGVGGGSFEAVVQRLSASLESCTLALLADDNITSPDWQNKLTTDSIDDEYY